MVRILRRARSFLGSMHNCGATNAGHRWPRLRLLERHEQHAEDGGIMNTSLEPGSFYRFALSIGTHHCHECRKVLNNGTPYAVKYKLDERGIEQVLEVLCLDVCFLKRINLAEKEGAAA